MIEVKIAIEDIQYGDLAKQFIPQLIEGMKKDKPVNKVIQMLSGIQNMPGALVKTMLDALPQSTKDELAVYFVNQNKEALLAAVNHFMDEKQVSADIREISVARADDSCI